MTHCSIRHPHSSRAEAVATVFSEILETYGSKALIDMDLPGVSQRTCGTIACHAGWYFLMKEINGTNLIKYMSGLRKFYTFGTVEMTEDLGFVDENALLNWAGDYPDLWGNLHGRRMFNSNKAFGVREVSIEIITDHWRGVADRLRHLETTGELPA